MASIFTVLDKRRVKKDGTFPIKFKLVHNTIATSIQSGYAVKVKDWDSDKQKIRASAKYLISVDGANSAIRNELGRLSMEINKLKELGLLDDLSITDLKQAITKGTITKKLSFKEYGNTLIAGFLSENRIGSANGYKDAINFVMNYNKKDLNFNQFTPAVLKNMESRYMAIPTNHYNGLACYLRSVRAIFNKAINDGLATSEMYPFRRSPSESNKYSIRTEKTKKRAVSKDFMTELENYNKNMDDKAYYNAKYIFLFSFYMRGMNMVDIAKIKKNNISDDYLLYKRSKTGGSFKVKIHPKAMDILLAYGLKEKRPGSFLFPIIQRHHDMVLIKKDIKNGLKQINKYLRLIAADLGFDTLNLTSYVARHSWATIADKAGLDRRTIKDALGQADLQTTNIYIDDIVSDDVLEDADNIVIG